jgi:hypothetical protein
MSKETIPFKSLPTSLKLAFVIFGLHVILYSKSVVDVFISGQGIQPMWVIHIMVSLFLISEIGRARKSLFYWPFGYCLVIPLVFLRNEYVIVAPQISNIQDLVMVMYRSIIVCAPLYLLLPFLFAGRSFYLSPRPATNTQHDLAP